MYRLKNIRAEKQIPLQPQRNKEARSILMPQCFLTIQRYELSRIVKVIAPSLYATPSFPFKSWANSSAMDRPMP